MKFLIKLKQKDLSAVSAEQLYKKYSSTDIAPIGIDKYDLYTISGDFDQKDAILAVENSLIFFNPNKHYLIFEKDTQDLPKQSLYVEVNRKVPLALNSKMTQFNNLCQSTSTMITRSDLWEFKYSKKTDLNAIDLEKLTNTLVVSSESNTALFAHPLIHDTTWFSLQTLKKHLSI